MFTVDLPYGQGTKQLLLPVAGYQGTFAPRRCPRAGAVGEIITQALDQPVDSSRLEQMAAPHMQVVIVTSDQTRPCPNDVLLPPLLARLNAAGVPDAQISIIIALGLHRPLSSPELETVVGPEVFGRVRVFNHDPGDVVRIGVTRRGTPVEILRSVPAADLRVLVGNVEFHYFAGFSGGLKALIPGVASPVTVRCNHSHMVETGAAAARLQGNPVREDLEEAAAMVGADFLLNVIVDENRQVLAAAAGHPVGAHRRLCQLLQTIGVVEIPTKLDLAVVSAGGYPKDVNLYQAQKALDNIAGVVREDGVLVLLAQCPEGYGNTVFRQWMSGGKTPEQLLADLGRDFVLGGHKAAAIGKVALQAKVLLATSRQLAAKQLTGITAYWDPARAVRMGLGLAGQDPVYAVFPYGASTLPRVTSAT